MPWQSPHLDVIIEKAKHILKKFYPQIPITAQIFIATRKEMRKAVIEEQKFLGVSDEALLDIELDLRGIEGEAFLFKK